ncbi:hypothetical protein N9741_03785 [Octadecabacter sp.]|nr:hypothetical protein [Octadecabacter sp.]
MPAKRRRRKGRASVSDRAQAIYRNRPKTIEGNVILDEELADELHRSHLIAYPDIGSLIEELTENRA